MNKNSCDVFISYSRKDTMIANRICDALDSQGISYFIDRQGIGGGLEFPEVLADAIVNCRIMLYIASINSYGSKFTNNEITFAFNEKSKGSILPYIIDGSRLPASQRLIFASVNIRTLEEHPIESVLMQDLCQLLGKKYIKYSRISENNNRTEEIIRKAGNSLLSAFSDSVRKMIQSTVIWILFLKIWNVFPKWLRNFVFPVEKAELRSIFVSTFIYGIQAASIYGFIASIIEIYDKYKWIMEDISWLWRSGMPHICIGAIIVFVFNRMIIKWEKTGFMYLMSFIMLSQYIYILFDIELYIIVTVCSFLVFGVYFGILKIPYNGASAWSLMKPSKSIWPIALLLTTLLLWAPILICSMLFHSNNVTVFMVMLVLSLFVGTRVFFWKKKIRKIH